MDCLWLNSKSSGKSKCSAQSKKYLYQNETLYEVDQQDDKKRSVIFDPNIFQVSVNNDEMLQEKMQTNTQQQETVFELERELSSAEEFYCANNVIEQNLMEPVKTNFLQVPEQYSLTKNSSKTTDCTLNALMRSDNEVSQSFDSWPSFEFEPRQQQESSKKQEKLPPKQNIKIQKGKLKNIKQEKANGIKKEPKKYKYDTKNVLRNFGAAQTNFIKHHIYCFNFLNNEFKDLNKTQRASKIEEFYNWVPKKPISFSDYQKIWSQEGEFENIYGKLCQEFYSKFALNWIYSNSKVCETMKANHLKYIHRFIEGIYCPSEFYYFRQN